MKQSDSTEMDRLLRRYARRNAGTLPVRDGLESAGTQDASSSSAHMDADELNAYAEGALPEAARSRYFSHLADCDRCRKLVTELTLASGVVSEKKQVAVPESSPSRSWHEWLGTLFSPPVLRYALPALALFGVIIVAIVMMRARRDSEFVSQNNQIANDSAVRTQGNSNSVAATSSANVANTAQNHAEGNTANSNIAPAMGQPSPAQPGVVSTPTQERPTTVDQTTPPEFPFSLPKPTVAQPGTIDKKQNTFGDEGKSGETVAGGIAPQPTPVLATPPPPAAGADDRRNKREEQEKPKNPPKEDSEVAAADKGGTAMTASKTAANEARRDRAAKPADSPPLNMAGRRGGPSQGQATDAMTEKDSSSETRSVSGRHFRRRGNAWVDTAYNSSRSTINVARGSEQYRALVADEPGLRAITQQLGGEVIVVWKSRAYRFY